MAELVFAFTYIFVASAITLLIANRLNQPMIPAYILAGLFVGFIIPEQDLLDFVQLGVAFLIFMFGLKFDPEKLRKVEYDSLVVNTLQIILIGIISFSFAYIIGFDPLNSFYFSLAATLSSSLVGLELVSKEVDLNVIHGRLAESTNLIQDMIAIAAFVIISSAGLGLYDISLKIFYAATILLSAFLIRKYIFDLIARQAEGSAELLMLVSISSLTIFMAVSEFLGLSIVIGAFAAGISVAKFPHNLEIMDTMGSLKDFFSAIFFVTLGALISLPSFMTLILTISILLFTIAVKPALMILSLIHQGYDLRTSFLTGTSLDQVSEFALIIAIQAWLLDIIFEPLFQAIILATTVSMITSSYTSLHQHSLFEKLEKYNFVEHEEKTIPEARMKKQMRDHIILVGYDTQGRNIVEHLEEKNADYVIIENDPEKISELRVEDKNFVYGNALNGETWEYAGLNQASLIVSTAPFKQISDKILELETGADKITRTESIEEAEEMLHKGAVYVIVPQLLTADLLKEHIIRMNQDPEYLHEIRRKNLLQLRKEIGEYGNS